MAANDSGAMADKSLTQQQQDLADEILELLGLIPPTARVSSREAGDRMVDASDYNKIRAAIAHFTITVCLERGAIS